MFQDFYDNCRTIIPCSIFFASIITGNRIALVLLLNDICISQNRALLFRFLNAVKKLQQIMETISLQFQKKKYSLRLQKRCVCFRIHNKQKSYWKQDRNDLFQFMGLSSFRHFVWIFFSWSPTHLYVEMCIVLLYTQKLRMWVL